MSAHRRTRPDDAVSPTRPRTEPSPAQPDPPVATGSRIPRRTLRVVAAAVLTVVGCAGWYGFRAWDAEATEALARADTVLRSAVVDLRAARTAGQTALAESAERVADNVVRRELAALLVDLPPTGTDVTASRGDRTTQARERADEITTRTALLATATETVRTEQAAWELAAATADHAEAVSALAAAVDEAAEALAASEGRVLDDTVRLALAEAVDVAAAVRDADAPTGTAALTAGAADAREHVARLAEARSAVAEAEAVWQAEQDRLAAEQVTAARAGGSGSSGAARSGSSGASSGRSSGSSGTSGSGSSGTSGGSSRAPGGTSGGGSGWLQGWEPGDPVPDGYQVVVESEGGGWGGDSSGNVWVH